MMHFNCHTILLNKVQTFGDLTGTHIDSDRDVVVYSGNIFTNVNGTSRDHLVDQMLPVHTWGRLFVTVPIPNRLVVKPGTCIFCTELIMDRFFANTAWLIRCCLSTPG